VGMWKARVVFFAAFQGRRKSPVLSLGIFFGRHFHGPVV